MHGLKQRLKIPRFISELLTLQSLAQLGKSLVAGILAALSEYLSFRILNDNFNVWYPVSNPISMAVGFLVSFLLNRFWSFKSKANLYKQLSMMLLLFFINICLSDAFFFMFKDLLSIPTSISKILVMGMVFCWNFIIYKKVIYKK